MAKTVTQLTADTTPASTDLLHLTDPLAAPSVANKKVEVSNLVRDIDATAEEITAGATIVDGTYKPGNLSRYGAAGSGDDTIPVSRWLDVGLQGVELTAPDGTFTCSTWTEKAIASTLTFRGQGNGQTVIVGPDTATNFLSATASVKGFGIQFDTFRAVVHVPALSAAIDFIDIERCRFIDCLYAVEKTRFSSELDKIRYLRFHRNYHNASSIADGTSSACILYLGPYEKAEVTKNWILNVNGEAIRLGDTFFAMQDLMSEAIVDGNWCDGMVAPTGKEAHGVIVYGRYASITNNKIMNLTTVDNTDGEGIYVKCRYGQICFNVLIDASDGQAAINIKGATRGVTTNPQGYGMTVAHNKIFFTAGSTTAHGINIENEDVEVAFNLIEGADKGIYTGSFELDHVSFFHNKILNTEGFQPILIQHSGKDFRCEENEIDGVKADNASVTRAYGIRWVSSAAISGCKLNGNTVRIGDECNATSEIRGIEIDRNFAINDLELKDNIFVVSHATLTEFGIRIQDVGGSDNWQIVNNDVSGVDLNQFSFADDLPTNLYFDNIITLQTTDATVANIIIAQIPDNSAYSWEAKVVGMKSDGSDRALYNDIGLFYRDGGAATQQGSTANIITPIESDANWALTIDATSNSVRQRVTGVAATTINWRARVKIMDAA